MTIIVFSVTIDFSLFFVNKSDWAALFKKATFAAKVLIQMKFKAEIDVMPIEALLDPQGKAVSGSMKNLGLAEISGVRIGKHITLEVDAKDKKNAEAKVDEACKKLLCNEIMEFYTFEIKEKS
jgi:phosphoribosylformylglycinamidine synthase subunit PurS